MLSRHAAAITMRDNRASPARSVTRRAEPTGADRDKRELWTYHAVPFTFWRCSEVVGRFILTQGNMRGRPSDACRFRKMEMVDVIPLKPGDALPAGEAAVLAGAAKDTS